MSPILQNFKCCKDAAVLLRMDVAVHVHIPTAGTLSLHHVFSTVHDAAISLVSLDYLTFFCIRPSQRNTQYCSFYYCPRRMFAIASYSSNRRIFVTQCICSYVFFSSKIEMNVK